MKVDNISKELVHCQLSKSNLELKLIISLRIVANDYSSAGTVVLNRGHFAPKGIFGNLWSCDLFFMTRDNS